jgi:hypothetical protein
VGAFLDAFLPNLAANGIAVVLGVPFAIWVNRQNVRHQESLKVAEGQVRLRLALDGLLVAADHNLALLRSAKESMEAGKIITGLSLNTSAWEVVRADVMAGISNLEVRLRLASFYEELGLFARHLERAVTFHYSPKASWHLADKIQTELAAPLQPFAARLLVAQEQQVVDLQQERARLG